MRQISFQARSDQPGEHELGSFPDFLVATLVREGYGRIEASAPSTESEYVPFIFKTQRGGVEKQIGEIGRGFFRSVLAQLAARCHVENVYAGHAFFESEQMVNGEPKIHRFSLFVCNERSMEFWFVLYLYGIASP